MFRDLGWLGSQHLRHQPDELLQRVEQRAERRRVGKRRVEQQPQQGGLLQRLQREGLPQQGC